MQDTDLTLSSVSTALVKVHILFYKVMPSSNKKKIFVRVCMNINHIFMSEKCSDTEIIGDISI